MGPWTWKLRNFFDKTINDKEEEKDNPPKIRIEGPYGGGNQDWYKFEVAVMVSFFLENKYSQKLIMWFPLLFRVLHSIKQFTLTIIYRLVGVSGWHPMPPSSTIWCLEPQLTGNARLSLVNTLNTHFSLVNRYSGVACKKVYFLWICPSHRYFEWFIDVLR